MITKTDSKHSILLRTDKCSTHHVIVRDIFKMSTVNEIGQCARYTSRIHLFVSYVNWMIRQPKLPGDFHLIDLECSQCDLECDY